MATTGKRPTLRDIADATGLSVAAVSYALRGERVAPETVERVRAVADELGYTADPVARALRGGRTGTVGVLVGSLADFWQQTLAHAIQRELRVQGIQTLLADADGDPAQELDLARRLVDQRVDGLIVAPIGPAGGAWAQISERVPLVTIGGRLHGAATAGEVVFDQTAGVGEVLRHLHALGHRRIAVLSWAVAISPDRPTEAAVREQAAALGLDCEIVPCAYSLDGSRPLALEVLERPDRPTAVFATSDAIAYGALHGCRELGLDVPGDVSICGFDDHPLSRLVAPPLTTASWDTDRVARVAVGFLVAHLAGEADGQRTVIEPRLVVRESTGPVS
ncbi:MAG: LacI family DNA-binding transcriptional regulator [Actinomycetota bacterium]